MKYLLSLLISFISTSLLSQDFSEINKDLDLTDVLQHEKEIRIYKDFSMTNYTAVFRLFQDSTQTWRAELNEHWSAIEDIVDMNKGCNILSSEENPERIWLNFLRSYAHKLPDMTEIQWKISDRADIIERNEELSLRTMEHIVADGIGYLLHIRNGNVENRVWYGNPEFLLNHSPEVDELIFFKEILDHVRTTYNIWKD